MNDTRDFDRAVDRWLDDGSDATPPEVINAVLLAVRSTPQERDFRAPWRSTAMTSYLRTAAVIVVAAIASTAAILTLGPGGSGSGGPNGTPSPSPALLARGSFVEHDWGLVEFEAMRVGDSVTGRMTLAQRDDGFGPITVDLRCTRETDDGVVMIGGYITVGNQFLEPGTPGWVAVVRGSPDKASVNFGSPVGQPAPQTTECLANLDAWLQHYRRGGYTLPLSVLQGSVEFGP